ncbi:MAG: mandelate racemase [Bryobacteraceae bacterium]|nr:mandelate racemase [Bryobacteraceae bacterium]
MKRRHLLGPLAAVPFLWSQEKPAKLKIDRVEFLRLEGTRTVERGVNNQHQVNPLHVYDGLRPGEYRDGAPTTTSARITALYLRITTTEGFTGLYGPVDTEAAIVVEGQLAGFLRGKDPLAVEALWDQMHRSNRHARSSHFMMAISAVDCALWDLRGRYFNGPVYRLLGGPTRAAATVYGSTLGYSVELEKAFARARLLKEQGFRHQKWFLAYGPGDGLAGLEKNVNLVRTLREAVGPDVDLMFDAFMGWDLTYATAWAKRVEPFAPRWLEEPFHVDKLESFAALRRATAVPVATGEHFYGRWEVQRFLRHEAITVVQADPEWCGGVSELVKIATLCSSFDAQLIPHGHSLHAAVHVSASQSPMTCPLNEYLILKMQSYYHFEKNPPVVVNGQVALSERPGFGIDLDPAKATRMDVVKLLA